MPLPGDIIDSIITEGIPSLPPVESMDCVKKDEKHADNMKNIGAVQFVL
jgi:hypothetical protein